MTVRKVVEIEWIDAQTSTYAMTLDELKKEFKPAATKSVGYLIHETKEYIILAFMIFKGEPDLTKHH